MKVANSFKPLYFEAEFCGRFKGVQWFGLVNFYSGIKFGVTTCKPFYRGVLIGTSSN